MINIIIITVLFVALVASLYKFVSYRDIAHNAMECVRDLKRKIKKHKATAVELELSTTDQILQELSKRGQMVLLIPHQKNDDTFVVETFAFQMSPHQTMNTLRIAFNVLSNHLDEKDDKE